MKTKETLRSYKILKAIWNLEKKRKPEGKITKEMVVVRVWKMYPEEFSMQGYSQYPNADISKYITRLFEEGLLSGGFFNYRITKKGEDFVNENLSKRKKRIKIKLEKSIEKPRYVNREIGRILNSKIFQLFLRGEKDFVESDLFEFFGTSSRSFSDKNKSQFLAKYNLMEKDIIPYCTKIKHKDLNAEAIIELRNLLFKRFGTLLNGISEKKHGKTDA